MTIRQEWDLEDGRGRGYVERTGLHAYESNVSGAEIVNRLFALAQEQERLLRVLDNKDREVTEMGERLAVVGQGNAELSRRLADAGSELVALFIAAKPLAESFPAASIGESIRLAGALLEELRLLREWEAAERAVREMLDAGGSDQALWIAERVAWTALAEFRERGKEATR